jgi:hypothetical protein
MKPISIRLFSAAGEPEGVLIASRDDWTGRAVIFPRELAGEVKGRKEYGQQGVYILVNSSLMYIGEGDSGGDRLDHFVNEMGFWRKGIFFTTDNGSLSKVHVQYLVSRLHAMAKAAGRGFETKTEPVVPVLSEEEVAFAENYLHELLLMLPILGFKQFSLEDGDEFTYGGGLGPQPTKKRAEAPL